MSDIKTRASAAAIFSAVSYGLSIPLVKLFGDNPSASWTSALLYFGAGIAMAIAAVVLRLSGNFYSIAPFVGVAAS